MMRIQIVAVGKLRQDYARRGVREYARRLRHLARVSVTEVPDVSYRPGDGPAVLKRVAREEGRALLKAVQPGSYLIALDEAGDQPSSRELAEMLGRLAVRGISRVSFVIGGSLGLSDEVRKQADKVLSLSRMTFSHELARLVLFEQLYRAFTLLSGHPYHRD